VVNQLALLHPLLLTPRKTQELLLESVLAIMIWIWLLRFAVKI